ncbi:hypothetical protein ABZV67_17150 [Streptomyces sp. NPDC005065]|uniref:hypothetical protein n=1 Tax=unclassified Streptomyces TaxID=2593676 RepID=UPI0033B28B1E
MRAIRLPSGEKTGFWMLERGVGHCGSVAAPVATSVMRRPCPVDWTTRCPSEDQSAGVDPA